MTLPPGPVAFFPPPPSFFYFFLSTNSSSLYHILWLCSLAYWATRNNRKGSHCGKNHGGRAMFLLHLFNPTLVATIINVTLPLFSTRPSLFAFSSNLNALVPFVICFFLFFLKGGGGEISCCAASLSVSVVNIRKSDFSFSMSCSSSH